MAAGGAGQEDRRQPLPLDAAAAGRRGQRRTDEQGARDAPRARVRLEDRERAAHRVAHEVHGFVGDGVDEPRERVAEHPHARAPRVTRRAAEPRQVQRDDVARARHERGDREPVEVRAAEAVNKHDGGPLAAEVGVVKGLSGEVDGLRDHGGPVGAEAMGISLSFRRRDRPGFHRDRERTRNAVPRTRPTEPSCSRSPRS